MDEILISQKLGGGEKNCGTVKNEPNMFLFSLLVVIVFNVIYR